MQKQLYLYHYASLDDAEQMRAAGFTVAQQMQSFETTPLYKIPAEIDFYTAGSFVRKKITISNQTETFEFDMKEKPVLVNFDAQKMILCTKTDNHSADEWITLYKRGPLYMDRQEALTKVMKSYSAADPEAEIVRLALDDAHWNIRVLAIRNSKPLITADRILMKQKLMALAVKDPKSDVRDEALMMLSDEFAKDAEVNKLMRNAVQDSSYLVMTTAVLHILEVDLNEGLALVKSMENDDNENIMELVSGCYKLYGGDDQFEYMTSVMMETKGYSKYTAVQNYGKFLLRCSPANATKGVDQIANVGGNYPQWVVRLSAVQSLSEIAKSYGKSSIKQPEGQVAKPGDNVLNDRSEIENSAVRKKAEELMIDIKSKEKDLNLMKIYHKSP